jgi:hypothetical protein
MRAEYTNRALSDLRKLSVDSRRVFGDRVAAELEVFGRSWNGYAKRPKVPRPSNKDQGYASSC